MTTKDTTSIAKLQGAKAYLAGVKVGDNPYSPSNDAHWKWLDGWTTAALHVARVPRDSKNKENNNGPTY